MPYPYPRPSGNRNTSGGCPPHRERRKRPVSLIARVMRSPWSYHHELFTVAHGSGCDWCTPFLQHVRDHVHASMSFDAAIEDMVMHLSERSYHDGYECGWETAHVDQATNLPDIDLAALCSRIKALESKLQHLMPEEQWVTYEKLLPKLSFSEPLTLDLGGGGSVGAWDPHAQPHQRTYENVLLDRNAIALVARHVVLHHLQGPASEAEAKQFIGGMKTPTIDGAKAAEVVQLWTQVARSIQVTKVSELSVAQQYVLRHGEHPNWLRSKPAMVCEARKLVDPHPTWDTPLMVLADYCTRHLDWWLHDVTAPTDARVDFRSMITTMAADLLSNPDHFVEQRTAAGISGVPRSANVLPQPFRLETAPLMIDPSSKKHAQLTITPQTLVQHLFKCSIIPDGSMAYFIDWANHYFLEPRRPDWRHTDRSGINHDDGGEAGPRSIPDPMTASSAAEPQELHDMEMADARHEPQE
ncbi:uncharacterized protein LAESUDRAFT_761650 [Laetiporus sulphureus 93-53]|uniref:Uncharacterized protein n=1 Tax=Laetiporus sulphureus 93-53 TaxID=1314785 RepID=A0A165CZD3_9APHY|nr:uncharacterized protein LAESUDRAFT_761650 [Laetiporus sulphureus 93-53]KZT03804.1 hypothetical protein LAESUDRAFT_761650 [Laetiporus sulphureus 93-53]